MIYTDLTKKAMKISFFAHKDQTDKTGMPYVYHPYHLAEQMPDEYSVCTALLHDVVEDTDMTLDDLKNEGFPKEVTDALFLLTHDKSVDYFDYVEGIKENPIAAKVKLADLRHNSDLSRLDEITPKDYERLMKYRKAIEILTDHRRIIPVIRIKAKILKCCDAAVPEEYEFCPICGKKAAESEKSEMDYDNDDTLISCSNCNHFYPATYRYCGYCGTKTGGYF